METKPRKRCPNGYRRNPDTGECEEIIDKSHAKLRQYIENNDIGEIKNWLSQEGIDSNKLCNRYEKEDVACPMRTTRDKIANAFVKEYAPWTKFGLSRKQYVTNKKAYLKYEGNGIELKYVFKDMNWSKVKGNEFATGLDQDYFLYVKLERKFYLWEREKIKFYKGDKPKNMKKEVLRLYVWDRGDYYGDYFVIAGKDLKMESIYKHLPVNYRDNEGNYFDVKEQLPETDNTFLYYRKNRANLLEMLAFQRSIDIINERFQNVVLSKRAPYLDKIKPNPLQQILGWDVKADFPEKANTIIRRLGLKPLGYCGPLRERDHEWEAWMYRFGVHETSTEVMNRIIGNGLHAYSEKIYKYHIDIFYDYNFTAWYGLDRFEEFLNDPKSEIAVAHWSAYDYEGIHARVLYKDERSIVVLDPWMQRETGTSAYKMLKNEVEENSNFSKIKFSKRPPEQARSEGSCSAISCARALALAELGPIKGRRRMPEWCPVFVKMLYNKFSKHAAARREITRGGRIKFSSFERLKL
tara:strand:+ start:1788 stop:3356 length:1569 start_codon:yes stop_codon:yes gene_type:complete